MAIATDVSKYLRDANPETVKWSMLLDRSKLIKYLLILDEHPYTIAVLDDSESDSDSGSSAETEVCS